MGNVRGLADKSRDPLKVVFDAVDVGSALHLFRFKLVDTMVSGRYNNNSSAGSLTAMSTWLAHAWEGPCLKW